MCPTGGHALLVLYSVDQQTIITPSLNGGCPRHFTFSVQGHMLRKLGNIHLR